MFNISIENQTCVNIDTIKTMLVQNCTAYAGRNQRKQSRCIGSLKLLKCRVLSGTKQNFTNLQIRVPPTCPSLLDTCRIIKIEYELKTLIDSNSEWSVSIPIVIGTEPYVGDNVYLSEMGKVDFQPSESRETNNDRKIKTIDYVNFYDPLYPVFTDKLHGSNKP